MVLSAPEAAAHEAVGTVAGKQVLRPHVPGRARFDALHADPHAAVDVLHVHHPRVEVQGCVGPLRGLPADRGLVTGSRHLAWIDRAQGFPLLHVVVMRSIDRSNLGHGAVGHGDIEALSVGTLGGPACVFQQVPDAPLLEELTRGCVEVLSLGQCGRTGAALEHRHPHAGAPEQVGHGEADWPTAADDDIDFVGDALRVVLRHAALLWAALRAMRSGLLFHSDQEPTNRRGVVPIADRVSTVSADNTPPPQ